MPASRIDTIQYRKDQMQVTQVSHVDKDMVEQSNTVILVLVNL